MMSNKRLKLETMYHLYKASILLTARVLWFVYTFTVVHF